MADSELIAEFCAITDADPALAESYLAVTDNNLQQAVSLFFESGGVSLESQHTAAATTSRDTSRSTSEPIRADGEDDEAFVRRLQEQEYGSTNVGGGLDEVRERIQPVRERLVDPGYNFLGNPFSSASTRPGIFNQRAPLRSLEADDDDDDDDDDLDEDDDDEDIYEDAESDREMSIEEHDEDGDDDILEVRTGQRGLSAHQSRLANLFRPPFDIMTNLLLDPAKEKAIRRKKWLLVNVQDSHEFQCQVLNRDLWSDPEVKTVVKSNFVFVQYPRDSPAGQEYAMYYPFDEYPHIAILDPRTGEQLRVWNSVTSPRDWLMDVYDFLDDFSLEPGHKNPLAKIAKRKHVDHMTEEEQIELAMKQSLGQDKDDDEDSEVQIIEARDTQGGVSGSASTSAPVASTSTSGASASATSAKAPTEDFETLTEDEVFATILPAEDTEEPQDPSTSTRIQIRLGTGQRIIRRFLLQDKVSNIFAVIKAVIPDVKNHYFILTTSDRRNLIGLLDQTVQEAKLQNSSILLEIMDN